ncbi:ATP-binding protein [Roseomonas elaeocarpi]|uniref:histidine kinase n=1 Tax=Roseomonas elaeocarpi TaxID=907779 RepID=A0ABV6JSX4_9PROT
MRWPLLILGLPRPESLVKARSMARSIAARLGFDVQDQARIATAVSEIARNAIRYAGGGTVSFALERSAAGSAGAVYSLAVEVADEGRGIPDLDAVLGGGYVSHTGMGLGIAGTRRLMDEFRIESSAHGTRVRFARHLPPGAHPDEAELAALRGELSRQPGDDPVAELQAQNRELLASLDALQGRQEDFNRVNAELVDTNRGVVALYSELEERAEELRRASELKTRFLSNMTHEFRTPLNSILALSRMLLDRLDGELSSEQERQVTYIRQSAENLSELVNDLLDLSKVEAGKAELRLSRFNIVTLFGALRGVLRPLQTRDTVELVFDDSTCCVTLHTDEGKVAQVLRNLVSNALKFTEAGEVRVSCRHDSRTGFCHFSVADTGIGIAPEDAELIFQEFGQAENPLQRNTRGTGLGLSLSRKLAELLGGDLTFTSTPGQGSTFVLRIPSDIAKTADPGGIHPRILLIDDEETSRYVLRHAMPAGIEVTEEEGGRAGLRRAEAEPPEMIFLDLRMPDLDGTEVLRRLAEGPAATVPVVICTSSILEPADRAQLARAQAILTKDAITRERVLDVMRAALPHWRPA